MKQSIVLTMGAEYDPDNHENMRESFGVTSIQKLDYLKKIAELVLDEETDDESNGHYAQETFIQMARFGDIPDNVLLWLLCVGAQTVWEDNAEGIMTLVRAEKEEDQ